MSPIWNVPTGIRENCSGPKPTPRFAADVLNVVVTLLCALMVTWQVLAVPVHAPLHPVNVDPDLAVTVSVTTVPWAKSASHAVPQSIPAGLDVTVPLPVPVIPTFRAYT